ncbi:MAG: hypothetical protein E7562_05550 [Ruminococcaceae bacterium]|nr:hypothetical protein [Oscillospiraceae bacterium]
MCYGQFKSLLIYYRRLDKDIEKLSKNTTFDNLSELNRKIRTKQKIEKLILNTDDMLVKEILILRFAKRCSWVKTAARMGQHYTPDNCRMIIKRHFEKRSAADFKRFLEQ